MSSVVTSKDEEVLNCELLCLTPSDLETCLLLARLVFESLCIEQVKYFLIVDLQEGAVYVHSFCSLGLFCLRKDFFNSSYCEANISCTRQLNLTSTLFTFTFFTLVALHSVRLARACLAVGEYSGVKSLNYFAY